MKVLVAVKRVVAIGADRAILVDTGTKDLQRLAVANLLKAIMDKEQPGLVILGKQAIDDDCNKTGQMLAALADLSQATFASKVEVAGDKARVTREVDGGLETLEISTPRHHYHRPSPERAALRHAAQHHEGQEDWTP